MRNEPAMSPLFGEPFLWAAHAANLAAVRDPAAVGVPIDVVAELVSIGAPSPAMALLWLALAHPCSRASAQQRVELGEPCDGLTDIVGGSADVPETVRNRSPCPRTRPCTRDHLRSGQPT